MLATPTLNGMFAGDYVNMVIALIGECAREGYDFEWNNLAGNSVLPLARNRIAHMFMQSEATHLLMVDADVSLSARDVIECIKADVDFAAIPYCIRVFSGDGRRLAAMNIAKWAPQYGAHALHTGMAPGAFELAKNEDVPDHLAAQGFVSAKRAGTGGLILKRAVFEKMQKKKMGHTYHETITGEEDIFSYFEYSKDHRGYFVGEDWTFCEKWRKMKGKIYLKINAWSVHWSNIHHVWDGQLSIAMRQDPEWDVVDTKTKD